MKKAIVEMRAKADGGFCLTVHGSHSGDWWQAVDLAMGSARLATRDQGAIVRVYDPEGRVAHGMTWEPAAKH